VRAHPRAHGEARPRHLRQVEGRVLHRRRAARVQERDVDVAEAPAQQIVRRLARDEERGDAVGVVAVDIAVAVVVAAVVARRLDDLDDAGVDGPQVGRGGVDAAVLRRGRVDGRRVDRGGGVGDAEALRRAAGEAASAEREERPDDEPAGRAPASRARPPSAPRARSSAARRGA
jgi:hypothetical protein